MLISVWSSYVCSSDPVDMIADVVVRRNVGDRGDLRHADRAGVLPVRTTIGGEHAAVTIGPQSHEHSAMVKEQVHRLLVDGFQMIDIKKRIQTHLYVAIHLIDRSTEQRVGQE